MTALSLQVIYFDAIKNGAKTIEGRLTKPKYTRIKPGDILILNNALHVRVSKIRRYPSFTKMLVSEGVQHTTPNAHSLEEGTHAYRQLYSEKEELKYGVIAMHIMCID